MTQTTIPVKAKNARALAHYLATHGYAYSMKKGLLNADFHVMGDQKALYAAERYARSRGL